MRIYASCWVRTEASGYASLLASMDLRRCLGRSCVLRPILPGWTGANSPPPQLRLSWRHRWAAS